MQLANIIALLNASGGSVTANTAHDDAPVPDHRFAELLSDSQAKNTASDNGKHPSEPIQEWASHASNALVAQEVETPNDDDKTQKLADLLTQPITPEEAKNALSQLESQGATDAFTMQLKAALTDIEEGKSKETIASLMVKLTAPQPSTNATVQTPAQLMTHLVQLLKPAATGAATKTANADDAIDTKNDAKDEDLSALLQSLEASLFRTPDQQPATPADTKKQPQEAATTVVEIIPLSAQFVAQVPANQNNTTDAAAPSAANTTVVATAMNSLPEVQLPTVTTAPANDNSAAATDQFAAMLDLLSKTGGQYQGPSSAHDQVPQPAAPITAAPAPSATVAAATANTAPIPPASEPAPAQAMAAPVDNTITTQTLSSAQTTLSAQTATVKTVEEKITETKTNEASGSANANAANPAITTASPAPVATYTANAVSQPSATMQTPVVEQVHVALSRGVKDGLNQMTIQLDPADLGRVEVKMHTNTDGQTQISFLVDKPSTLDSLARHAHGLERSLQDAGVKTDAGNMQFNLRQQPQTSDTSTGDGRRQAFYQPADDTSSATNNTPTMAAIPAMATRNYTLNIRDGLDIHA